MTLHRVTFLGSDPGSLTAHLCGQGRGLWNVHRASGENWCVPVLGVAQQTARVPLLFLTNV